MWVELSQLSRNRLEDVPEIEPSPEQNLHNLPLDSIKHPPLSKAALNDLIEGLLVLVT